MSRAYRIRLSQTEERLIHVADGVCTDLQLLPLLSKERMAQILAKELEARGFTVEDGKAERAVDDEVALEIDLETGRATAHVSKTVTVQRKAERVIYRDKLLTPGNQEREEAKVKAAAHKMLDAAERDLADKAARRLETGLRDLQEELDQIVTRVTAEALKEKAAQMGEIEAITEDSESGDLTITVRL